MSIKNSEKFKSFIFETVGSTWSLGLWEKLGDKSTVN